MDDGLYIYRIPGLTKIVRIMNGAPRWLGIDVDHRRSRIGDIVKGRVTAIEPAMNAAFVDIGEHQSAFLSAANARVPDTLHDVVQNRAGIKDLVKIGDKIICQVTKDATGSKAPQVRRAVTLVARHLVLTPGDAKIRVSKRIKGGTERHRIEASLTGMVDQTNSGAIVRGQAEGLTDDQLKDSYARLIEAWGVIEARAQTQLKPGLIHRGGGLLASAILDADWETEIFADGWGDDDFDLKGLLDTIAPDLVPQAQWNRGGGDLFKDLGLHDVFDQALEKTVRLPNGGTMHVETTEVATMIDLDTATSASQAAKRQALMQFNIDCVGTIADTISTRALSGLVLIDFLKVKGRDQQKKLCDRLRRELINAQVEAHVLGFTGSGLCEVVVTRTRVSLDEAIRQDDPMRPGAKIKRADISAFETLITLWNDAPFQRGNEPIVRLDRAEQDAFNGPVSKAKKALEDRLGRAVRVMPRPDDGPQGNRCEWVAPGSL